MMGKSKKKKTALAKNSVKKFTPFERESRRQARIYGDNQIGERVASALFYMKKRSQS